MTAPARALVLEEPRRLRLRELPLPELTADDGILRVEACGLCGTDHEQYTGALPLGKPFVPGHEVVGVVEAAGAGAIRRWGVSVGDRVAVEVFQSCRECDACVSGDTRHCRRHGLGDSYGFVGVDQPPGLWGGYATHLYLAPDATLLPVPASLDPVMATLFNPLGAGLQWTVDVGGVGAGDVVAVLGPGIRGLSAVVAAKDAGARFVMVTGHGQRDAPRLETARRFGADLAVDVSRTEPAAELKRVAGALADVVLDVTAKAPGALAQAIALARPGGRIVLAGTRGSGDTPGFRPDLIVLKELQIVGVLGVDARGYRRALDLLASGRYPFGELARRCTDFDGLEDLLRDMAGEGVEPPLHGVLRP